MSIELPEGRIDFVGQNLVNTMLKVGLTVLTILSFAVGFALQDLRFTFGVYGFGVLVLSVALLPPWPLFTQHPVRWLKPSGVGDASRKK